MLMIVLNITLQYFQNKFWLSFCVENFILHFQNNWGAGSHGRYKSCSKFLNPLRYYAKKPYYLHSTIRFPRIISSIAETTYTRDKKNLTTQIFNIHECC